MNSFYYMQMALNTVKEKRSLHIKENSFPCKEIIDVGITFGTPLIRWLPTPELLIWWISYSNFHCERSCDGWITRFFFKNIILPKDYLCNRKILALVFEILISTLFGSSISAPPPSLRWHWSSDFGGNSRRSYPNNSVCPRLRGIHPEPTCSLVWVLFVF